MKNKKMQKDGTKDSPDERNTEKKQGTTPRMTRNNPG